MVERVNDLPVMNPDIVTGISLLMFFSVLAVKKGFLTLLLAHIMFCIPYVMLSVTPKLRSLDPNLIDAAMDLGATPFQALTRVIVPQIRPGIVSGALIAFTMSFDDFVISYFTAGSQVSTLSMVVYSMVRRRVSPEINALSTLAGFPLYTIGLVCGFFYAAPVFGGTVTGDPKQIVTLFTWALYAILFHNRLARGWRGRKPAKMMILIFTLSALSFIVVNLFMNSHHAFIRN